MSNIQSDVYIHYGHHQFDSNLFREIKNRPFGWVKPYGGLWASNINASYGWKDWCKDENFRECNEENSFKFTLKNGTKVLKIDNADLLKKLPVIDVYPINVHLDFEKLKQQYDAIEVIISNDNRLYWDLYGWDCDSILIFNKDCIEIL